MSGRAEDPRDDVGPARPLAAQLSEAVGRMTKPVRSFGVKKVDFGGMSRPRGRCA